MDSSASNPPRILPIIILRRLVLLDLNFSEVSLPLIRLLLFLRFPSLLLAVLADS